MTRLNSILNRFPKQWWKGSAVGIREWWSKEAEKRKCSGNVSMEKYAARKQ